MENLKNHPTVSVIGGDGKFLSPSKNKSYYSAAKLETYVGSYLEPLFKSKFKTSHGQYIQSNVKIRF